MRKPPMLVNDFDWRAVESLAVVILRLQPAKKTAQEHPAVGFHAHKVLGFREPLVCCS